MAVFNHMMIMAVLAIIILTYAIAVDVMGVFLVVQRHRRGHGPSRIPFPIMWVFYALTIALFPSVWLPKATLAWIIVGFHALVYWIIPFVYCRWRR